MLHPVDVRSHLCHKTLVDMTLHTLLGLLQSSGIDDAETECDLDKVTEWDWRIVNNGRESELEDEMQNILSFVNSTLNSQHLI